MPFFVLMVIIIGATSWMQTARIVRGDVLSIKEQEFILASRSIGTRSRRVIFQNVVPNVMSPVIVAASLGIAVAILTESAVSFLGLGFPQSLFETGRSSGRLLRFCAGAAGQRAKLGGHLKLCLGGVQSTQQGRLRILGEARIG